MSQKIDIIIPVYGGYEETVQCIQSVLSSSTSDTHTVVINDCSPDEQLVAWLSRMASQNKFELLENQENLGFAATVNRGMSLHPDRDVILLNSDTVVANDWVQRLAYHGRKKKVGTVTPFSNNATICSFPIFCQQNELIGPVDQVDLAFKSANAKKSARIPTAVGFCMFINRRCLDQTGLFDDRTFADGYGEENDFCMRASRLGWRHLLAADIFVAHLGGVSFANDKRRKLDDAARAIDKLYPDYHSNILLFTRKNPHRQLRLLAHAEYIHRSAKKVVLLISHRLGGGVEKYLQDLETVLGQEGFFIVLRPGAADGEYDLGLSVNTTDRFKFSLPGDYEKLLSVCRFLGVGLVYFNHIKGGCDLLCKLADDLGCDMDFVLHDYYVINANPTLTDRGGRFCADPAIRDEKCSENNPIPEGKTAKQWRSKQHEFLSHCRNIVIPSQYAANLFKQYFPDIPFKTIYHPDLLNHSFPSPRPRKEGKHRSIVLVLGAINKEKGLDIIEKVALLAADRALRVDFHLLGYACRPLKDVIEHGPYSSDNVQARIASIQPDIIWFPAQSPETYSYTLSEALRTDIPILASDIGAFPERLAGRPYASVANWRMSPDEWLDTIQAFLSGCIGKQVSENYVQEFYEVYKSTEEFYGCFWENVQHKQKAATDLSSIPFSSTNGLTLREELLLRIIIWRKKRGLRWVSAIVPYRIQQQLKRWLSDRPLHELVQ